MPDLPTSSVAAVADAITAVTGLASDIQASMNTGDMVTAKTKASLLALKTKLINDLLAQAADPTPENQNAVIGDLGE
jgi:hypothetical protein